ncbi:Transcriptional regulatory protein DegU [compost metagenome]
MTSEVINETPLTIVTADDSLIVRTVIAIAIDNDPRFHLLGNFSNGLELIQAVEMMQYPPDICLLDIIMPICNGVETAKLLQANYSSIALFAYTSLSIDPKVDQMYHYGVEEVFYKQGLPLNRIMDKIYEKYMLTDK